MNLTGWLIVVPLLLILEAGGGMILITRLLNYTDNITLLIIIWIVFFTSLSIFGFIAGKKNWKNEYGWLLNDLHDLKKTLKE